MRLESKCPQQKPAGMFYPVIFGSVVRMITWNFQSVSLVYVARLMLLSVLKALCSACPMCGAGSA